MNRKRVYLLLALLFTCGVAVYFGSLMTTHPKQISGNGNLGLIFLPVLLLFFLPIVSGWTNLIEAVDQRWLAIGVIALPVLLTSGYRNQQIEFEKYRTYVIDVVMNQEGRGDLAYAKSITSDVFSTYMNNQLFNLNTFLMYIGLSIWVSILIVLFQKKKLTNPNESL
ncbi:hypothetical protein [Exiguobacterium sp. s189]|uniref:hypothetical protein n=1 Tax=Exiguobacterium sp. s189 TaxID=2751263 RepID=UPI001BEA3892|nr:hypothetical protein [Exiguobacterium sp. s189]